MTKVVQKVSLLSRLLYRWIIPTVKLAGIRQLRDDDLRHLPFDTACAEDSKALERQLSQQTAHGSKSLVRAIIRTFSWEISRIFLISLALLCSSLAGPLLLRNLLQALAASNPPPTWFSDRVSSIFGTTPAFAYPLASTFAMVANSLIAIFLVHGLFFVQPLFARRVRAVLARIIFDKSLRQQRSSRQQFSSGFVMNLVSTDLMRVDWFLIFAHSTWYHPLTLACAIILLYKLVGVPALLGSLTLLLIFSASLFLSRLQSRFRKQINVMADSRVGLTRETLLHIKAAKLQGWESKLAAKIQSIRSKETHVARKLVHLAASLSFLSSCAPALAMAVTTIYMVNENVPLEASTLFPTLSLFTVLRFSMSQLPDTIYNLVEAIMAFRRIEGFLDTPEYHRLSTSSLQTGAIEISGLRCMWPNKAAALEIDKLSVTPGELVVIVGAVGAGKSTLLLTLLGEIEPESGSTQIGGEPSYVSQNPWIISDSIRNNILCGESLDAERYRSAMRAAGLTQDLASLPHGDATQIGERGINLSGGQRHRVALARAFYRGGDIFLFDDPLSALDPGVANHVFTQMILGELSGKTRVVVSHRVEYALSADRIVVVEDGRIREQGSPDALRNPGTRFSQLLHFHERMNRDTATAIPQSVTSESVGSSLAHSHDTATHDTAAHETEAAAPQLIMSEERAVGAVAKSTIREYISRLAPGKILFVLVALFILRQGASVVTDLWLTLASGAAAISPQTFIKGYLTSITVLCVMAYLRATSTLSRGLQAGLECHERLLRGVLRAPMKFFESNPVGRILNRFSRDLETVELHLPRAILDAGSCLSDTLAVLVVIALVAPLTLVVVIPVAVLYVVLFRIYRPVSRDIQRLTATTLSPVFALLSECLAGVETLRAARLQQRFMQLFSEVVDANARVLLAQTGINRWLGVRLEMLGLLVMLAVGLVISLGLDTMVGVAFSGLVLTYAGSVTGAMNWAVRSLAMVENSLTSFERIERYASQPPEALRGVPPPPDWPSRGDISVQQLSIRYRPELPMALSNVSFQITSGMRVGIIGRTGSGKSTLILSLMRLLEPSEGYIEIDGVNLSSLALEDLRNSLVVVPQEPVLFSGSLRESLDPFRACSDEEIHGVLQRVELWPLFCSLPERLDTSVQEGGFNFSSGQRQLICLARALLRKSRVIILDEATASIDVQTDYAIQRAIRQEFRDSTVLVIAHRLGTVLDSDLILTLQDGNLAEAGAPAELLATPGSILGQFVSEAQRKSTASIR